MSPLVGGMEGTQDIDELGNTTQTARSRAPADRPAAPESGRRAVLAALGLGVGVAAAVFVVASFALEVRLGGALALGMLAGAGGVGAAIVAWLVASQRVVRWLGERGGPTGPVSLDAAVAQLASARDGRVAEVDAQNARLRADLAAEATAAARADAALARARQDQADHLVELDGFEYEQRATAQAVVAVLDLVLGGALETGQEQLVRLARRALADTSAQHSPGASPDGEAARIAGSAVQGFNVRRAVASVLRLLAPRIDQLGVELVVRFSSDVPSRVEADRALLWRALTLIADFHAARSYDAPAVYVNVMLAAVAASERDSHERTILFTIEDVGPALDAAQLNALFTPTGAGELGAVGLGFARRLAEAGGGSLSVEGVPDGGLRTTFALPAVRLKRVTVTTLYGRGALTEKAVLVVDDVAYSRAVVSELISSWRLLPTAVASGEAALDALRSAARTGQPFDAIVLDRVMPELSGEQLLRAIRDDPAIGPQRILLLDTASGLARTLPEDVRPMVGDVVQKPVVPSELLEALTMVLAPPRSPPPVTTRPVARPDPGRRAVKVLVAEDNPVNQMFVARMLERRGHQVTVANNGAEVIDCLDTTPEPYDIILMDVQMPVLDGFEATGVIRERESRRPGRGRIPIIAVTAHAMKGEERRCLDSGMDGYIPKPIVEEALFAEVERLLPPDFHTRARKGSEGPATRGAAAASKQGAAASPGAAAVFDEEKVLHFVAGDRDFLLSLVELFVTTAPRQVEAIAAALEHGDPGALQRAAHQLKGAVGNFAADRARRWADELEQMGREGRLAETAPAFAALKQEIEALRAALKDLAQRHGAPS